MTKYTRTKKERLLSAVKKWPQVSFGSIQRGQLRHRVLIHEDWCPTVNGGTWLACTCDGCEMSVHLQPDDPEQVIRDIEEAVDGAE